VGTGFGGYERAGSRMWKETGVQIETFLGKHANTLVIYLCTKLQKELVRTAANVASMAVSDRAVIRS
jgi:hypothetical protein